MQLVHYRGTRYRVRAERGGVGQGGAWGALLVQMRCDLCYVRWCDDVMVWQEGDNP